MLRLHKAHGLLFAHIVKISMEMNERRDRGKAWIDKGFDFFAVG